MKNTYTKKKASFITRLGGKCVSCGKTSNLEFDHIDRSTKKISITKNLYWSGIEDELTKCQLLCKTCHLEKTKLEFTVEMKCGTRAKYNKRKCRCEACRKANTEYIKSRRSAEVGESGLSVKQVQLLS